MRVVKPSEVDRDVPRGVVGGSEISQATTGAVNIYMGLFRVPPGARSRPHYHEGCESAVYMTAGELEVRWGDHLEETVRESDELRRLLTEVQERSLDPMTAVREILEKVFRIGDDDGTHAR